MNRGFRSSRHCNLLFAKLKKLLGACVIWKTISNAFLRVSSGAAGHERGLSTLRKDARGTGPTGSRSGPEPSLR